MSGRRISCHGDCADRYRTDALVGMDADRVAPAEAGFESLPLHFSSHESRSLLGGVAQLGERLHGMPRGRGFEPRHFHFKKSPDSCPVS